MICNSVSQVLTLLQQQEVQRKREQDAAIAQEHARRQAEADRQARLQQQAEIARQRKAAEEQRQARIAYEQQQQLIAQQQQQAAARASAQWTQQQYVQPQGEYWQQDPSNPAYEIEIYSRRTRTKGVQVTQRAGWTLDSWYNARNGEKTAIFQNGNNHYQWDNRGSTVNVVNQNGQVRQQDITNVQYMQQGTAVGWQGQNQAMAWGRRWAAADSDSV